MTNPALAATRFSAADCDQAVELRAPYSSLTIPQVEGTVWIEIREQGAPIRVDSTTAGQVFALSQPLRNASTWIHARAGDIINVMPLENRLSNPVSVVTRCDRGARREWLARLLAVDRVVANPGGEAALEGASKNLEDLVSGANTEDDRALVAHYRALLAFGMNRARLAADLFASAEEQWRMLGERRRAQAARLGRIESEALDGPHEQIAASKNAADGPDQYFDARMLATRCGALEAAGRLRSAASCYRRVLIRYQTLGESNEVGNTYYNLATNARKRGDLAGSRDLAARGLASASGAYAPMVLGRLHALLAAVHRQSGNIAAAFHELQNADDALAGADINGPLYRAYGRLYAADLLEQVGAPTEAFERANSIWTLIRPADAGSMLAYAAIILSNLERDAQQNALALVFLRIAEIVYARDNEPIHEATRLARLQLQYEQGDVAAVDSELSLPRRTLPAYDAQWHLLEAGVSIAHGQLRNARRTLEALQQAPLPLRDQIRLAVLYARCAKLDAKLDFALAVLTKEFARISELAGHASSAAMRRIVLRQGESLRREALAIALDRDDGNYESTLRAIWPWLAPTMFSPARPASGSAAEFDAAVARQLLGDDVHTADSARRSADAALFARLAQPAASAGAAAPAKVSLTELQRALPPHSLYVALVEANPRSVMLVVSHDDVRLLAAEGASKLSRSVMELRLALQSRTGPAESWQSAAQTLSKELLGELRGAPPDRLYVPSNGLLADVAWPVLVWPGAAEPLAETTVVVRTVSARAPTMPSREGAHLRVFVAPQTDSKGSVLPELPVAAAESELIQAATDHPVSVASGQEATRDAVLSTLAVPGSWIHVAAHGMSDPQRMGYSGLWLESPIAGGPPAFLSWLDVLDRGVRADLVVLDACQLDSHDRVGSNLSFAEAIADAGAGEVVAAAWPVSDAAAALWVPTFYNSLRTDPALGVPGAVREAQRRLRRSREFAHPFYWAGLQVLAHIVLAPPINPSTH